MPGLTIRNMDQRLDRFERRFATLEARFDELRSYVSFALCHGQMNFLEGNELEELTRSHAAGFAEIERRRTSVEEQTGAH